jgi:hypothetical protein
MAIVRNKGFVPLRRGLFEHVQNGTMAIGEAFLYMAVLAHADPATGVWISTAGMLSAYYGINSRTCKDWLAKLEEKGYLRRFMVQGTHSQYPILVHKYQCTEGAQKGMRLNAWESTSYNNLKYEPCPDQCPEHRPDGALTVPQSTREGEKGRKIHTPKASPSSFVLPDWIPIDVWNDYEEMRKGKRAAMKDSTRLRIVKRLAAIRDQGYDPVEILEKSIRSNWTDVFPPDKPNQTTGRLNGKGDYNLEVLRQSLAEDLTDQGSVDGTRYLPGSEAGSDNPQILFLEAGRKTG